MPPFEPKPFRSVMSKKFYPRIENFIDHKPGDRNPPKPFNKPRNARHGRERGR